MALLAVLAARDIFIYYIIYRTLLSRLAPGVAISLAVGFFMVCAVHLSMWRNNGANVHSSVAPAVQITIVDGPLVKFHKLWALERLDELIIDFSWGHLRHLVPRGN